jgi:O-antigen/teichoic acid export membrane protein
VLEGSIRRRVLKGFGANAFGQVTAVIVNLAGVPIFLHFWGVRLYGEWLILIAIPVYLSMMDLGFCQAASHDMTARIARGQRTEALAVFQSLNSLVVGIAGAGLVLTAILLVPAPLDHWFSFEAMNSVDVRWVLCLLAVEVLIMVIDGVSHAGLRADGDYPVSAVTYTAALLLQHTAAWCMAALGTGPVGAAAAFLGIRTVFLPLNAYLLVRRHPWLIQRFNRMRLTKLKPLFGPAVANLAIPLGQIINLQGAVILIGAILGPAAVASFVVTRTLTRLLVQAANAIGNAVATDFAAAFGANNIKLLRELYLNSQRGTTWITICTSLVLLVGGEWIVSRWTGGRIRLDAQLFQLLLATAFVSAIWQNAMTLLRASNHHARAAILLVLINATGVTACALVLRGTERITAVGAMLLASEALLAIAMLRTAASLCGLDLAANVRRIVNPLPLLRRVRSPNSADSSLTRDV